MFNCAGCYSRTAAVYLRSLALLAWSSLPVSFLRVSIELGSQCSWVTMIRYLGVIIMHWDACSSEVNVGGGIYDSLVTRTRTVVSLFAANLLSRGQTPKPVGIPFDEFPVLPHSSYDFSFAVLSWPRTKVQKANTQHANLYTLSKASQGHKVLGLMQVIRHQRRSSCAPASVPT